MTVSPRSILVSLLCLATVLHFWAVAVLLPLARGIWGSHSLFFNPKEGACWSLPPALW